MRFYVDYLRFFLRLVQNRAARIVTFTKKYENITLSLIDLHLLPVEYRIIYKILLSVYKAINGLSPSYISNLLSFWAQLELTDA